jgi:autophagy-related protein 9
MESFNLSLENLQKEYLKKHFLKNMYFYYLNKGYYNIIYTHLTIILSGIFLIFYTIFLYNCIQWEKVINIKSPTQIYDIMNINDFFRFNLFICIFFITFMVILIFRLVNLVKDISTFGSIKHFFNDELEIEDIDLGVIKWKSIINKFKEKYNDDDISIYYINNKITCIDNYFISLIDKNIIKTKNISKLFEWNIKYCFINSLYSNNKYDIKFINKNEEFYKEIEKKILSVIIVNFIFMPFIINYMLLYNIFNYGEKLYTNPSYLFNRIWTRLAKWKFRNYNELYHEFRERITKSYKPCNEYSNIFHNKILETVSNFLLFILSSVFVTMILFSIINEKLLINLYIIENKQMFWFMGLIGSIIAILRSNTNKNNECYPTEKMKEIKKIINSIPEEWLEIKNTHFFSYNRNKLVIILYDFVYTINAPFDLFYLYLDRNYIFDFLNNITINSPQYGHINKYALFENNNNILNDKKHNDSIETFRKNNI